MGYIDEFLSFFFFFFLTQCSVSSNSFRPHGLTVACQAPLSMGFSRQEYWSGLPFSLSEDLPDSGIELGSPALQVNSLPAELPGKPFDCVDHNKLWEILKEMGIPDHLTYLLRNLYAGQEAT